MSSILLTITFFLCSFGPSASIFPGTEPSRDLTPYELSLAKSTLGFGRIFALSVENQSSPLAWRQSSLFAAARLTGLDIDIFRPETEPPLSWYQKLPLQSNQHEKSPELKTRLPIGTALSRKGHTDLLHKFLDSGLSTALIIEDDADWDVVIREQLRPDGAIAEALRSFEDGNGDESQRPGPRDAPYDLDWDIMHLGHCHYNLPAKQERYVKDPTAPDLKKLRAAWSTSDYAGFPEGKHGVFLGASGVCTFAYGVTRAGAQMLLDLNHWNNLFDSVFWDRCADGQLKCSVIAPELIHHQRAVGTESTRRALDLDQEPQRPERFFTMNIRDSARCNANSSAEYVTHEPGSDLVQCLPNDEEFEVLPN